MNFNLNKIFLFTSITIFTLSGSGSLYAAGTNTGLQNVADPEDPAETIAADKASKSGKWGKLLPLPIFITEPAIGYGLGASLIYFHKESKKSDTRLSTPNDLGKTGHHSKPPPTATAIFAFYTETETAGGGIGHSQSFADDRYRLRAALANTRINSQIYQGDVPVDFQLEGNIAFADLKTRIGDSNTFFRLSTSYLSASSQFDDFSFLNLEFVDIGLGYGVVYDNRDNTVLPGEGFDVELTGWIHDEAIGSDFDYSSVRFKGLWYKPLGDKYVLGLRLDSSMANGNVPFYAFPYVRLRGIPALRYQGEVAGAFELEGRRRLGDRWEISLFTGVGYTQIGDNQAESDNDIRTIGFGARWLAFREQDAWVGVDVARGPDDLAFYIQMGSAW